MTMRRPTSGDSDPDRPKNSSTCTACRRRRVRCNRELPCSTCITRGIADTCDSPPQTASPYLQRASDGPGLRNEIDRIRRMADVLESLRPGITSTLPGASRSYHNHRGAGFSASYPSSNAEMRADSRLSGTGGEDGYDRRGSYPNHTATVPEWLSGSSYRSTPTPTSPFDSAFFPSATTPTELYPSTAPASHSNSLDSSYSLFPQVVTTTTPYGTNGSFYNPSADATPPMSGYGPGFSGLQSGTEQDLLRSQWEQGQLGGIPSGQVWSYGGY